jgi:hypothetical protein
MNGARQSAAIGDPASLPTYYRDAPNGVRANMIYRTDGGAAFADRAGALSFPVDQQLLRDLRVYADVIPVGAGTARAEQYGPVRRSGAQKAERDAAGLSGTPRIAVISQSGRLLETLFAQPGQPPILITSALAADRYPMSAGAHVLLAGEDAVDIGVAVAALRERGLHRILARAAPRCCSRWSRPTWSPNCASPWPRCWPAANPLVMTRTAGWLRPRVLHLRHALAHEHYVFTRYVTTA